MTTKKEMRAAWQALRAVLEEDRDTISLLKSPVAWAKAFAAIAAVYSASLGLAVIM